MAIEDFCWKNNDIDNGKQKYFENMNKESKLTIAKLNKMDLEEENKVSSSGCISFTKDIKETQRRTLIEIGELQDVPLKRIKNPLIYTKPSGNGQSLSDITDNNLCKF